MSTQQLSNLDEVEKRFKRFNAEDQTRLDSICHSIQLILSKRFSLDKIRTS